MSHPLPQPIPMLRLAALGLLAAMLAACASAGQQLPPASYGDGSVVPSEEYTIGPLNGITDESYFITGGLTRRLGQNANIATNAYVNWFDGAGGGNNDVTAFGGSVAYNQSITQRLTGRAAIAVDYVDSEFTAQDFAVATALVGLRYDF
ncbi:MAG: hypothetical protein O9293_05215 [Porphyrobacter sp.]|nr:hypothetical protein [Porphyrobacter sp.]